MMASKQAPRAAPREHPYAHPTRAAQIRELLTQTGLSQRKAAEELEVNVRTFRYWCEDDSDRGEAPRVVILALERLADLGRRVATKD